MPGRVEFNKKINNLCIQILPRAKLHTKTRLSNTLGGDSTALVKLLQQWLRQVKLKTV